MTDDGLRQQSGAKLTDRRTRLNATYKISRIVSSLSERVIYLLRNLESGMQKGAQLPTPTHLRADLLISEKRKCQCDVLERSSSQKASRSMSE